MSVGKLCLRLMTNFVQFPFQAIAHYEQAADYYKGEESTR